MSLLLTGVAPPSQEFHVLLESLIYDGRSIPLMSQVVPSDKHSKAPYIQKAFLDALSNVIPPDKKVIIVTDAEFQNTWFRYIKSLGWDFIGRVAAASEQKEGTLVQKTGTEGQ